MPILEKGSDILQPHRDGVLDLPILVESESTEATPNMTCAGGNDGASPILGNVLTPHTDGVLALLIPIVILGKGSDLQPHRDGLLVLPAIVEMSQGGTHCISHFGESITAPYGWGFVPSSS